MDEYTVTINQIETPRRKSKYESIISRVDTLIKQYIEACPENINKRHSTTYELSGFPNEKEAARVRNTALKRFHRTNEYNTGDRLIGVGIKRRGSNIYISVAVIPR